MTTIGSGYTGLAAGSKALPSNADKMALARKLEAGFLSQMLKAAGLGEARDAFGGGAGEDQFSSFLVQEYADAMVSAGGLGLSESIYLSLVGTEADGR